MHQHMPKVEQWDRSTVGSEQYRKPRTATVHFHTVKPIKTVDLLSDATFDNSDPSSVKVDVPCGLFRFIDVELDQPLEASR